MQQRNRPTGLRAPRRPWWTLPLLLALVGPVVALPGCGGCRRDPAPADKEKDKDKDKDGKDKEKKKPKPDFQFAKLRTLPGDATNAVKPGHWMAVSQQMKANNFNFNGELQSAAVDRNFRPLNLERTPYRLQMSRPASLPKGQAKHMEMTVFVPRREGRASSRPNLLARLRGRGGGRTVMESPNPTTPMEPFQYYLVALARRPDDYGYLNVLDSIRPPRGDFGGNVFTHYRVVLPKLNKHVPLPSNPLLWTCVAYIIWDDIDPDLLSLDQQDALIDWLHFGGQLVVSGPGSLETLKNSFLLDYLPATAGKTIVLDQPHFDELNRVFTLPGKKDLLAPLTVVKERPPQGVQLKLHEQAEYVSKTGELLAERQIGRGRIVVTSFSLTNPQIVDWRNFDGFFNACILRRPGRNFWVPQQGLEDVRVGWKDVRFKGMRNDPRLVTNFRLFTRDMGYLRPIKETREQRAPQFDPNFPGAAFGELTEENFRLPEVPESAAVSAAEKAWGLDDAPLFDRGFRDAAQSGVGGWNDFSGASDAARRALKQAAGITVPERGFVLRVLAVYLIVLVPLNWIVFRALGRVEWAWVAAPIIAILGAVAVVRLAQLDIGFARSRTEVAVFELQGEHPRGHFTRYIALYTSLSSRYNAYFEDHSALAQPFATDPDYKKLQGQTSSTATFRRDKQVSLRGFKVASNSTSMLHTEELRSIGGPIELEQMPRGLVVINKTSVTLKDVGVIRRRDDRNARGADAIQVAWIGELKPQRNATLKFGPVTDARALLRQWQESPVTSTQVASGEVSLVRLLDLARDPRRLQRGDMKLIGWTGEDVGGIKLSPRASQTLTRTLVVSNLKYGPLPEPQPDANTHDKVKATVAAPPLDDVRLTHTGRANSRQAARAALNTEN